MSVKPDHWIAEMAIKHKMIDPFQKSQIRQNSISFGLSSYGYDMRIADEFKLLKNKLDNIIDPKNFEENIFENFQTDVFTIPAYRFILARSVEYFRIPRNIICICFGKSTYARCGIVVNITPFEPEWEGYVTMAISNTASAPVKMYANEGIAQVLFLESDQDCLVSYADRKGKYQAQQKITTAKL